MENNPGNTEINKDYIFRKPSDQGNRTDISGRHI